MKIELRQVKKFAAGSQETQCFVAMIYIDGKKAGMAQNHGRGGMTIIQPATLVDRLNTHGKSLPGKPNAEAVIDNLLMDLEIERDLKTKLKNRILFTMKGKPGIKMTGKLTPEQMQKGLDNPTVWIKGADIILNSLPLNEAVDLFKSHP